MRQIIIVLITVLVSSMAMAQTTTENYVKNTTYQVATQDGSVTNDDKIETIQYFDGLGRLMQSVAKQAGGNKQDIITPVVYDVFGRQAKEYLPYANPNQTAGSATLNYRTQDATFFSTLENSYLAKFPDDIESSSPNPFSEKHLEVSPLNRVLEQGAPGADWAVDKLNDADHTIKFEYQANETNEVKVYNVVLDFINNTYEPNLISTALYYTAGELHKTVTKDENWTSGTNHTTEEFKDKQGRVVLKRTYADINNVSTPHDTYYVYDRYGNLSYVIPPKAGGLINPNQLEHAITSAAVTTTGNTLQLNATQSIILSDGFHAQAGSTFSASIDEFQSILDALCYQYKYDQRNRLVEKKIPGKDWEYIVYNKLDQPVLTQDANLDEQNKWLFTKYDAFGRVAYTGEMTRDIDRVALQTEVANTTSLYVTKQGSANTIDGTTIYYDNAAYPTSNITALFTINYYDNYTFDKVNGNSESAYGITPETNVKGLATGSKVCVLDSNDWITTVTYYDDKSRPIYLYSFNDYLDTTDKVKSKLDFTGKVEETTTIHARTNFSTITTIDTFTYDHAGRLIAQKQKVNTEPEELIVLNTYDELGQLENKKVGGAVASDIKNSTGLQTVNYDYNIRGWLKQINDPSSLGTDLFSFKLNYNTVDHNGTALYNGNIAETEWKTNNTDNGLKWYAYNYDALNRINSATGNNSNYNLGNVDYDMNGNILNLQRQGHTNADATLFGNMDDLVYSYDGGNKLTKVQDNGNDDYGFKDGTNTDDDFIYDVNGNMTRDKNKGVYVGYNHLNLPREVEVYANGTGVHIEYVYDATGAKLKKTAYFEAEEFPTETIYAGNSVYEDRGTGSSLKFFNHPEGYVDAENGYSYVYQYKDHLGNVRLSYKDSNNNGSVTSSEILEENNYYPFGLEHQGYNNVVNSTNPALKRKFGGKEYQDELGLGWYDVTARNYDPALGRWMNLDPLAEQMRRHSPYNYAFDNPIFFIDRDGMAPDDIYLDENGNYLGEDGAATNNVRVIYGDDFNQVKADNSGSTISLKATAKLQSLSNVVTIDGSKIQNDIDSVNNETINDQSAERQTYITLNIDSKSAGNPTAVVTSQRGADGSSGQATISSQTTHDGRNTVNGQQNVLIGQVHSHNDISSTTTTTTGNTTTITTTSNTPGTSSDDVSTSNMLGIPIYSIDSYTGTPAISVPAPFVGGAGPAMHRVSNGVQTNNIGTTATQNVGQDALSIYIKNIKP